MAIPGITSFRIFSCLGTGLALSCFLLWSAAQGRQSDGQLHLSPISPTPLSPPEPVEIGRPSPSNPEAIELLRRMAQPDPPAAPKPLRRLKLLTSGALSDAEGPFDPRERTLDAADPSLPAPFVYPDGSRVHRITLSGLYYLEGLTLDELLRGGIHFLHKVRGFFPDGTEMTGPSFFSHYPWDCEVHQFPDGRAFVHGGSMVLFHPGSLPGEAENYSRTRQWGDVRFQRDSRGRFQEQWLFRGFLHGGNPRPDGHWIGPGHFHNYGGTFFRTPTGEILHDEEGNTLMAYDRVTLEWHRRPWETAIYARKMDASLNVAVGPEIPLVSLRPSPDAEPWPATRRGAHGEEGFLLEGPRPFSFPWKGKTRWGVTFSGGDFTRESYGVNLAISDEDAPPLSLYHPVLNEQGDIADFARGLRHRLDATWGPGRPTLFQDDLGNLWMLFHFIPKSSLPPGFLMNGEPRNPMEAAFYARRVALAPVKIVEQGGIPGLALDETD